LNLTKLISTAALIALASCWAAPSSAQVAKDGSDGRFYDDLLDHLVGKWEVDAVVHGQKFTLEREAEWVLSHQYLRINETSREVIPWLKVPFERTIFIGFNHATKRYIWYELTVHGADTPYEPQGFAYGVRNGNELQIEIMNGAEVVARSRLVWDPAANTWIFQGRRVIAGKEQEPHVEQKAVAVAPSSN